MDWRIGSCKLEASQKLEQNPNPNPWKSQSQSLTTCSKITILILIPSLRIGLGGLEASGGHHAIAPVTLCNQIHDYWDAAGGAEVEDEDDEDDNDDDDEDEDVIKPSFSDGFFEPFPKWDPMMTLFSDDQTWH